MTMKTRLMLFGAALVLMIGMYVGAGIASSGFISAPPAANVDVAWTTTLSGTTGTGTEIQLGGATQVAVEYEIATGTTSGVVVLEHSAVSGYAGTWANLDTQTVGTTFATAPSKTFFTYPGPMGFIRPRITTTFAGGGSPLVTVRVKRMFGQ